MSRNVCGAPRDGRSRYPECCCATEADCEYGTQPPAHQDDAAVDAFAQAMKDKLAIARAQGRGGWDDPSACSVEYLAQLMREQLLKPNADLVDIGNFAMFLFHRPGGIEALRASIAQAQGYLSQA